MNWNVFIIYIFFFLTVDFNFGSVLVIAGVGGVVVGNVLCAWRKLRNDGRSHDKSDGIGIGIAWWISLQSDESMLASLKCAKRRIKQEEKKKNKTSGVSQPKNIHFRIQYFSKQLLFFVHCLRCEIITDRKSLWTVRFFFLDILVIVQTASQSDDFFSSIPSFRF